MSCACSAADWPHLVGLCVKADLGEGFIFSCSLVLWPFSQTGHVPIGQSHSNLVACQPQMPEACPHFLSPSMRNSAGPRSLQHRKVASHTVWGQRGQILTKASRCYCYSNEKYAITNPVMYDTFKAVLFKTVYKNVANTHGLIRSRLQHCADCVCGIPSAQDFESC